jgi:hypothetical protein
MTHRTCPLSVNRTSPLRMEGLALGADPIKARRAAR